VSSQVYWPAHVWQVAGQVFWQVAGQVAAQV
jgi:hypothetical protein